MSPRDSAKPVEYYEAFVSREQEAMSAYTSYDNPALFMAVAPKCVRIGMALYSAGKTPAESLEWFGRAAEYQRRFLAEGAKLNPGGPGSIDNYLELYSAAFLADRSADLIRTWRQCTYTDVTPAPAMNLIEQFCDLLDGRPIDPASVSVAEVGAMKKDWAYLPPLFVAVSAGDMARATTALEEYVVNSWAPMIDRESKRALKSPNPDYWGRWSAFAAAVCRMARIGALPERLARYVPMDLVAS